MPMLYGDPERCLDTGRSNTLEQQEGRPIRQHPNEPQTQKRPRRTVFWLQPLFRRIGAGEGIRTLDPNLGKVVLYP